MYANCTAKLNFIAASEMQNGSVDDKSSQAMSLFDMERCFKPTSPLGSFKKNDRQNDSEYRGDANFFKFLVRAIFLFLVTSAYFLGFSVYTDYFIQKHDSVAEYLAWSSRTWFSAMEIHYRSTMLYSNTTISLNNSIWDSQILGISKALGELDTNLVEILHGDDNHLLKYFLKELESNGVVRVDKTNIIPLLFDSYPDFLAFSEKCIKLESGVMNHGLYNSLLQNLEIGYDIFSAVISVNNTSALGKNLYSSYPPVKTFDAMAFDCLPEYFQAFISELWIAELASSSKVDVAVHIISTILLIFFLAAFFKFSVAQSLNQMKQEISLSPSMLLMIDPQVYFN